MKFPSIPSRLCSLIVVGFLALPVSGQETTPEIGEKLSELVKSELLPLDPNEDKLQQLRKERYNEALRELKERNEALTEGLTTIDKLFEVGRRLLESRLALSETPQDRVRFLKMALDLVKEFEEGLEQRVEDELASLADLHRVRWDRLTIEIELLKAEKTLAEISTNDNSTPAGIKSIP